MEQVEEQVQLEQEQVPEEVSPEVVERAKSMGWIPKEEFRGDETKWRPANEYVERAEHLMPILKSQLGKYETEITNLKSVVENQKSVLENQKKTTEKILKMSEKVRQQEYDRARRELVKQQAQAVANGDVETWQNLEDQKERLEKPEPVTFEKPENQEAAVANPVFTQWHSTNNWYANDQDLTIFADGFAQTIKSQNPNMPYDQVLAKVESKVKEVFPQKFSNPSREKPPTVNEGGGPPANMASNKKTYNNLPSDAKAQCDAFIAQGVIKSREQYVKDYFELEA